MYRRFSHSLRGLCGLKSWSSAHGAGFHKSQPARAVWIEIYYRNHIQNKNPRHSLRGLCGLKLPVAHLPVFLLASQPARAVWIEIRNMGYKRLVTYSHSLRGLCGLKSLKKMARISYLSHSLRGLCGLKLQHFSHAGCRLSSQPARAVWIEIK